METVTKNRLYIDKLFTETFEPKDYKNFVLPKRIKSHFPNGEILNNSLLCGTAGCGKSSFAKYLGRINNNNFYYLNSSLDTSKGILEEGSELHTFCSTFSFEGKRKVVLFDEIDGVSASFFNALKGFMDTFNKVRFIATTNHIENIPAPILSRFSVIDYNFESKEEEQEQFDGYKIRIYKIMTHLGIAVDSKNLNELCKRYFPDFRSSLQLLQRLINNNIKTIDENVVNRKSFEHNELYSLILNATTTDNRHIHTELTSISNPLYAIHTMDNDFMDYLEKNNASKVIHYGDIIITIAKYNNMVNNRVDPMICLKALVFELIKIVR